MTAQRLKPRRRPLVLLVTLAVVLAVAAGSACMTAPTCEDTGPANPTITIDTSGCAQAVVVTTSGACTAARCATDSGGRCNEWVATALEPGDGDRPYCLIVGKSADGNAIEKQLVSREGCGPAGGCVLLCGSICGSSQGGTNG